MAASSVGVAILLVCLGMTKYAECVCEFLAVLNAHTEGRGQLTYVDGETVVTTCFQGHATNDLRTEYTRTCTGGQWVPALDCNPVTCSGLPVVEGADILFLSEVEIVDNIYPALATALVICPTGMSTDRGRLRYMSQCSYSGTWDDTSPCSVSLDPDTAVYTRYQLQLVETSVQFTSALSDSTSTQAQDLAQSVDRALFPAFESEFGTSFVGLEDFMFSQSGQGVAIDFTMLFLPSVNLDLDTLRLRVISALNENNYQQADPNTGTSYTFERDSLDLSQEPISQFTRESTIGLSIAGAAVAILFFALIIVCCCCRPNNKPFSVLKPVPDPRQHRGLRGGQSYPAPPAPTPYAQLGDVPYRLQ